MTGGHILDMLVNNFNKKNKTKMKKIAIHKADNTSFPSLPLMKISAYYKSKGYAVENYMPLAHNEDIQVFSSKVFTFTQNNDYLPHSAILGGTGYKKFEKLADNIEHIMPDYNLYSCKESYGFITRGCSNSCEWCIVPKKEGSIYFNAHVEEFLQHNKLILLDNNILACDEGVEELKKIAKLGIKIDINQGVDSRLIDNSIARIFASLRFIKYLRLACDTQAQINSIKRAVDILRKNGFTQQIFCYCLLREERESLSRIEEIRKLDLIPFAQPYRNFKTNEEPPKILKKIARWCNYKPVFNTVEWKDYKYA